MNERISSSTDEALGMRVFEVSRQRAVERCIARWRNGLKSDWTFLSQDDINNLRWIAGELWTARSRDEWDQLHFSKVDLHQTRAIVSHADRLRRHRVNREQTLNAVTSLLADARLMADERMRTASDAMPI